MFLTVTLNPSIDKVVWLSDQKIAPETKTAKVQLYPAGKGINVSRALCSSGVPVCATGFLGGVSGAWVERGLRKERIPNSFYFIQGKTRVNTSFIQRKTGRIVRRDLESGPVISKRERKFFILHYLSLLKQSRCVIFSGSCLPGQESLYAHLVRIAQKHKVPTVLDTRGKSLALAVLEKPDILKINRKEAEELFGRKLPSFLSVRKVLRAIMNRGIQVGIITLASQGAVAGDSSGLLLAKPPKIQIQNYVGCGDAFLAGFCKDYFQHPCLSQALKTATAWALANTTTFFPGKLRAQDIGTFLPQIQMRNF